MAYNPSTIRSTRPAGGSGTAFGTVPQAITPPDPFSDLAARYPNLGGANEQISKNVMSELKGELSPETIAAIQDNAASFGVTSGMPGSQFTGYSGLRNLGLQTEKLQGQGLQDYLGAITGLSRTQTLDPNLQTEIGTQNAVWGAAPDPALAAQHQEDLFNKYVQDLRSPAGGTNEGSPWARPPHVKTSHILYGPDGTPMLGSA